jgi:RNA exonuclease 1
LSFNSSPGYIECFISNKMASADAEITDLRPDRSSDSTSNGKKRKFEEDSHTFTTGNTMAPLPQPDLPKFNLTLTRRSSQDSGSPKDDEENSSQDWQTVEHRAKKKAKKIPKAHSKNYPSIQFSKECRLNSQIKISDLQSLVLYILADGSSPQFVSVRHRPEIRKVVVLMVPGLEKSMFDAEAAGAEAPRAQSYDRSYRSPDEYYPNRLKADKLPESLQPFADMFEHIWPVRTPGDDKYGKMHSPLHAMLTAPLPKSKEEKSWNKNRKGVTPAKEPHGWKNSRTSITEFIHTAEILLENDYTLHPASYDKESDKRDLIEHRKSTGVSEDHGWVDSLVKSFSEGTSPEDEIQAGSITAGRDVLAMDCEMCMTGENEFSLTRISIVGWDGSVILDELVKPAKPITNYVTQYVPLLSPPPNPTHC